MGKIKKIDIKHVKQKSFKSVSELHIHLYNCVSTEHSLPSREGQESTRHGHSSEGQ